MQMRRVDAKAQPLADGDDIPAAQERIDLRFSARAGWCIVTKAYDPLVAVFLDGMRHHVDSRPMNRCAAIERQIRRLYQRFYSALYPDAAVFPIEACEANSSAVLCAFNRFIGGEPTNVATNTLRG